MVKLFMIFSVAALFVLACLCYGAETACHDIFESEDEKIVTTTVNVLGMTCKNCVRNVTKALKAVGGVTDVSVVLKTGVVTVTHDPSVTESEIRRAIVEDAGYRIKK